MIDINNKITLNNDLKSVKKKILLIDSYMKTALCEMFSSYDTVQKLPYEQKFEFLNLSILNFKLVNTKVRATQ